MKGTLLIRSEPVGVAHTRKSLADVRCTVPQLALHTIIACCDASISSKPPAQSGLRRMEMTSSEIERVIDEADSAWHSSKGPLMNTSIPTDVAAYRASLEVAWQLAILNEQIGNVLNSRIAQIAVRCEGGEYPLQVQVQEPQRRTW